MNTDAPGRQRTNAPAKPWVRRRRMLFASLFGGLGLLILIVAAGRYVSQRDYERRLEAIRAEGVPVTVEELQRQQQARKATATADEAPVTEVDTVVPPAAGKGEGMTAAKVQQEESERLEQLRESPTQDEIQDIVARFQKEGWLSPEDREKLRNYVSENADLIQTLLGASKLPPGVFELDYSKGFAMELPHLARLRQVARVLLVEAVVAALDGDADLAFEALTACAAVQQPLRDEDLIISQLVRAACNSITVGGLISTLGMVDYTDEQLAALQQAFQSEHAPDAFTNALVTERVFALQAFEDPAAALVMGRTWMDEIIPGSYAALVQTANAFGWFVGDREEYLQNISDMIEASRLPYLEARPIFSEIESRMDNQSLLPSLNSMLLGGLSRVPEAMAANDARLNIGNTAAAIERYRLATGALPAQLSDLASANVGATLTDPFDGQTLRYRREGDGYVLYSIGPNSVDDGGVSADSFRDGDVVFRRK